MRVLSFTVLADGVAATPPQLLELLDTATIASAIAAFVPLVVAFITKRQASDRVKSVTNLLSVAAAAAVAFILKGGDGQPVTFKSVAAVFIAALTASLVAYKGAWKPLQVAPAIARATESFGVGKPTPAVTETARPGQDGVL